jgi:hypothetical protein
MYAVKRRQYIEVTVNIKTLIMSLAASKLQHLQI